MTQLIRLMYTNEEYQTWETQEGEISFSSQLIAEEGDYYFIDEEGCPTTLSIYNGTPHAINVVEGSTFNPSIRKFTGGNVVLTIPSSGMLNAKIDVEELSPIGGIPIFGKKISGCDPLPEGYDMYIVSALYSSAILKTGTDVSKVYTVADPVMSEDGATFLGCRGLAPLF